MLKLMVKKCLISLLWNVLSMYLPAMRKIHKNCFPRFITSFTTTIAFLFFILNITLETSCNSLVKSPSRWETVKWDMSALWGWMFLTPNFPFHEFNSSAKYFASTMCFRILMPSFLVSHAELFVWFWRRVAPLTFWLLCRPFSQS